MTKSVVDRSASGRKCLRACCSAFTLVVSLLMLAGLGACSDDASLGHSLQPGQDIISVYYDTVPVHSRTVVVDSILTRSASAYLGTFTDPFFGTTACDFMAQLYCPYDQVFPDDVEQIDSAFLYLYYDSWFGDSTTLMHVSVYELDKPLSRVTPYYSNHDVSEYIRERRLLGETAFTAGDMYATDSMRRLDTYQPIIRIPIDVHLGNRFLNDYRDSVKAAFFKSPDAFNQYFNGLYVDCDFGNGSITYVTHTELELCYGTLLESKTTGVRDSFVLAASYFPVTKEVRQINRFTHPDLTQYLDPFNPSDSLNYVFSPAGLFTQVSVPLDIFTELNGKAINAMHLKVEATQPDESTYAMAPPGTLLLVRATDVNNFFAHNSVTDGLYAFMADYDKQNACYDFDLSYYAQKMVRQLADSTSGSFEPYTDMLLVPVTVVKSSDGDQVRIEQLLTPSAVKVKAWNHPVAPMKLEVVYSKGKVN